MSTDELLDRLPELPQRQDSTLDQLKDLLAVANKLGMHDAADAIRPLIATGIEDNDLKKAAQLPGVVMALQENDKIKAIKATREAFGWSLKEAKGVVDDLFVKAQVKAWG